MAKQTSEQLNIPGREDERELLMRCQRGDNDATEEMLNRYKNMVRSKATALYLVGADKEDLIQEGMIGLFKAIREYDPERNDSFAAFAGLCITRQMYTAIKASNTKKNQPLNNYVSFDLYAFAEDGSTVGENTGSYEGIGYWQKDPEESVIDRENAIRIEEEVFSTLSAMERQVLSFYASGMPYQEIARVMEKEPKSIDNALQRIRKKLKTVLAIKA
ncbi:MAG: sigma-70 family RNA polymerase sigma factor [Lachnospiraceae bacterium]|nr:sigma-70 family RNA polymerase sigma factor [Lachnospiraceae bacterium]